MRYLEFLHQTPKRGDPMAGMKTRTQLLLACAIVDLPAFLGAAGGRDRMAGPDCSLTGH
jgi:hypothetical protein